MKPCALKIDYLPADRLPILEREQPVFTWAVAAAAGESCAAARLTARCGGDLLWDSGFVPAPDQAMTYAGSPIPPGEVCSVSLTLRDEMGRETPAAEGSFCLGALPEWPAPWLRAPEDESAPVRAFFRDFACEKPVLSATLFVCGLGYHKAYLNGQPLFTDPMNPAYSEYEKRAYYTVIPGAEKYLRGGLNRLGVRVASGWRDPDNACYKLTKRVADYAGPNVLTAALRLRCADGSVSWLCTDPDWRVAPDPAVSANIFMGETYDASLRVPEWCLPGVPLKGEAPLTVPQPCEKLMPQTLPPVREQEIYTPMSVSQVAPDTWSVDFGQNIAGVCRLRLPDRLPAGTRIELRHMESLDEDGRLMLDQLRGAAALDTYIASGDGRDLTLWQPEFTYHGFQYAEVTGYPGPLTRDDIQAVALYTDVEKHTRFMSGSALIDRIARIARQTEKSNIHSVLTDCPQRDERMGWLNDATVRFEATPYVFDVGALFQKVVRDCLDVQGPDGSITCTAPFAFGNRPADPVCSSFLIAAWQAWLHTGNMEPMREGYPGFVRWNDCLAAHAPDGIVDYSYYGDWAGPAYACLTDEHAVSAVTPGILMSTGYHYFNCTLLSRMAELLGLAADRDAHLARAEFVRRAFLEKWFDPDTGRVATGSQGAQAFALWLGILPEESRQKAADIIHQDLAANGYRITTGNLCSRYILDVLTRFGYLEDAWAIAAREEYPSLGYMVQHGATTVWERFELKKNPGMNSHDHPMYASAYYWYYAFLAGLTPTDGGWRRFRAAPALPKKLCSVNATVETPKGDVTLRWVRCYGEIHLYLTVPYGAEAEVILPWSPSSALAAGPGFHHWSAPDD